MNFRMQYLPIGLIIATAMLGGCNSITATDNPDKDDLTAFETWTRIESDIRAWHQDAMIVQMGNLVSRKSLALKGKPRGWDIQVSSNEAMATLIFSYHAPVDSVIQLGKEKPYTSVDTIPYRPIEDMTLWKVDSDEAFSIAEREGGKEAREADPELDIIYSLHWSPKFETIMWDINYGSHTNPSFEIEIDATTGDVLDIPVPFTENVSS